MTDPQTLVSTRTALQSVAEHVLAAARHAADGHIGLRVAPTGLTTPPYPSPAGERTVAIEGTELVVTDDAGVRRTPLITVAAAAAAVDIAPGAPTDVFTPTTALAPDQPLALDVDATDQLLSWYRLANTALAEVRAGIDVAEEPSDVQLWPEHFDVAFSAGEVNYGASPGDAEHPLPYLYVGPWAAPEPDGGYWNEAFGASASSEAITTVADAIAFFAEGHRRVATA